MLVHLRFRVTAVGIMGKTLGRQESKEAVAERIMERILEEMEGDSDFAEGRIDKLGPNGRELCNDRWEFLGADLNEIAHPYYNKSGKQWKDFHNNWRLRVKKSMREYLTEIKRTGNFEPTTPKPGKFSWRMANIYGWEGVGMDLIPESGIFDHDDDAVSLEKLREYFHNECKKHCKVKNPKRRKKETNSQITSRSSDGPAAVTKNEGNPCTSRRHGMDDDELSCDKSKLYHFALQQLEEEASQIPSLCDSTEELARSTQRDIDLLRSLCGMEGIEID